MLSLMSNMRAYRTAALCAVFCAASSAQSYRVTGSIKLGGTGGWDYLTADSDHARLYVSHSGEVQVVDLHTNKLVGSITGMKRIHGIALAPDLNAGFISDGGSNQVIKFDLKTLAKEGVAETGTNPDGIVYDAPSKRVFAFNGRSLNATVIDATSNKVVGSIALGGKPEFPVSDDRGMVYDNIEDKNEIVAIDSKTMQVKARWSVAPCESPSGLAIDKVGRRLFAVCDEKKMAVVDADSGKVVATPEIGEGPDAAAYDSETKLAFSSNGQDGTLTIIKQNGNDSYSVLQTIPTAKSARTMALDTRTHKIYLSSASLGPAPSATAQDARPRPTILPGSFQLLIVSQ